MKTILLLIGFVIFRGVALQSQCPPRDSLWHRLVFVRDSSAQAGQPVLQLKELLNYESRMANCAYRNDSTHALLLQRIGVLYSKQSDFVTAIEYIKRSINIVNSKPNHPSVNYKHLIRSYYILSVFYGELKKIPEKMNAIDSCVLIAVNLNSADIYTLFPLFRRVEYLYDIGDYQRAFEFAAIIEPIIKKEIHGKDSVGYIVGLMNLKIIALISMRRFDEAEKILLAKIEELKSTDLKEHWGTIYEQLAEVQVEKNQLTLAYQNFQRAYQYDLRANYPLGYSETLTNMGYALYFKKYRNWDKAVDCYRKSLIILKNDKIAKETAALQSLNLYGNIAAVFVEKAEFDSAFTYFQLAFDQIRPGIQETELLNSTFIDSQYKKSRFLVSLMIEKGDTYVRRFKKMKNRDDLRRAISVFKLTDQLLDKIKSRQTEIQSKLFWRADNRHLYEKAIEACYLADKPEIAFYFFEKSRAVLLSDQLKEQHWFNEKEILELAQVKKNINGLKKESEITESTASRYKDLQKEIFVQNHQLEKLEASIKKDNSFYYQHLVDSSGVTVSDLREKLLIEYSTIVELFAGDSSVYSLIISANDISINKFSKNKFDSLSNLYISLISNSSHLNHSFKTFEKTSNNLFKLVFGNVTPAPGRVIISPDGQYFPFEALVTLIRDTRPVYFIENYGVSYTYSVRYLLNSFSAPVHAVQNFIGAAPVHYSYNPELATLTGSDQSMDRIGSYFSKPKKLVSENASRNNFMQLYWDHKVVQLYTHASDSSSRGEPVIWFADSGLYLSDLISENKPLTRLIVLSACQTANGKLYHGEGVFSFNRGFAALGIPSSITNLWSVDSKSTYQLTELFYKYLADGLTTDIALQKAKLQFIQDGDKQIGLPYYWAAPILVGKAEVIQLTRSFPWTWILTAGIGLSAIGIIYILRRRRKLRFLV